MRKYRIVEVGNYFYPQEKKWFWWSYLDNLIPQFTWKYDRDYHSRCESKYDAEKCIEKRIKYLQKSKEIIHEYKQQDNGK